jgi:hypothetical protein
MSIHRKKLIQQIKFYGASFPFKDWDNNLALITAWWKEYKEAQAEETFDSVAIRKHASPTFPIYTTWDLQQKLFIPFDASNSGAHLPPAIPGDTLAGLARRGYSPYSIGSGKIAKENL